jgi:hypothetical protein
MKNYYNFFERLLHRLVLSSDFIGKVSFELDSLLLQNSGTQDHEGRHVFICGLARSGSSMTMRIFHETGVFRSLTYRDMPFVLMPTLWERFSANLRIDGVSTERPHGDGVYHDFDTPEAFEEIFWRVFSGHQYILDNKLRVQEIDEVLVDLFRGYIRRLVVGCNQGTLRRYLSKNNNNILRIDLIRDAFPKAVIIVPFRDPIQQSLSLLRQHRLFLEASKGDGFVGDYMKWLGHYDFGADHKPPDMSYEGIAPLTDYSELNINYWLALWIVIYSYLLKKAELDVNFLNFDRMVRYPKQVIPSLFRLAGLSSDFNGSDRLRMPEDRVCDGIDARLMKIAQEIYNNLLAISHKLETGDIKGNIK